TQLSNLDVSSLNVDSERAGSLERRVPATRINVRRIYSIAGDNRIDRRSTTHKAILRRISSYGLNLKRPIAIDSFAQLTRVRRFCESSHEMLSLVQADCTMYWNSSDVGVSAGMAVVFSVCHGCI